MKQKNEYSLSYEKAKQLSQALTEFLDWCKCQDHSDDVFKLTFLNRKMVSYDYFAYQDSGGVNLNGNFKKGN